MSARIRAWSAFIAGTDTGVGKTRVTVALLHSLSELGVRAAGMKAVASGTDAAGVNEDVHAILTASTAAGVAISDARQINPYCFPWPISPHLAARRAGVSIDANRIRLAHDALAVRCEGLLVEGTGGWLAPIGERETMADVARALALPVLLVVGMRLGCLNHALLTARALSADGVQWIGWIGSIVEPQMLACEENLATLAQRLPVPCLGVLPYAGPSDHDSRHLREAARALCRMLG